MLSRHRAAVIGATLVSLIAVAASARAETIPLPRPAPKPKIMAAAEPAPAPRPPLPLQNDPATTGAVPAPTFPVPPAARSAATKPGTATAFDAQQRALLDKVNAYLSGLTMLVGNFVQVGPDGRKSQGQFYLQKPGKVRFDYDPPSQIALISNGQDVAVRDRRLATQDIIPLGQTPLRFLLAERIDLMRDTNVIAVRADETFVSVMIEERQTLGGTHRLTLMFSTKDYQLKQWTVTDPQGFDTTVALYNLDATKKPDPELFKINYERMLQ